MTPDRQLDAFRDSPAKQAQAWRAAAESSRKQFPHDENRYRYYAAEAERMERMR